MPGLVPGIPIDLHHLRYWKQDGRAWASEATPFLERLCPAMTHESHT